MVTKDIVVYTIEETVEGVMIGIVVLMIGIVVLIIGLEASREGDRVSLVVCVSFMVLDNKGVLVTIVTVDREVETIEV